MYRTNALTKAGIFYQLHLTTLLGGAKLQRNFHRISLNWSSATLKRGAFHAKNKKYVVRIVCGLVCGLFATPDLCRNWSQQTTYRKQS